MAKMSEKLGKCLEEKVAGWVDTHKKGIVRCALASEVLYLLGLGITSYYYFNKEIDKAVISFVASLLISLGRLPSYFVISKHVKENHAGYRFYLKEKTDNVIKTFKQKSKDLFYL